MQFVINETSVDVEFDTRTSLLDLLRDHLHLHGSKKLSIRTTFRPPNLNRIGFRDQHKYREQDILRATNAIARFSRRF